MYSVAGVGDRMLRDIHCSKGVYICTQRPATSIFFFLVHYGRSYLPQGPSASTVLHHEDRCVNSPSNTFPKTLLSLFRMRRSGSTSPSCPWGICYRQRKKKSSHHLFNQSLCVCLVRFILSFITALPSFTLNMKLIRKDPHHSLKKK